MKMDEYVTMGQQVIHRRQNKVIMKYFNYARCGVQTTTKTKKE